MPRPIRMRPLRAPGIVRELVQFHDPVVLCSGALPCGMTKGKTTDNQSDSRSSRRLPPARGGVTFAIMPRTDGVSSSSRLRCSLLRPRPIQPSPLIVRPADRAADLGDPDPAFRGGHGLLPRLGGRVAPTRISLTFLCRGELRRRAARCSARAPRRRPSPCLGVGRSDRLGDHVMNAERLERWRAPARRRLMPVPGTAPGRRRGPAP